MNKLGFYTQKFQFMTEPIKQLQPPVMLAEMSDRGFLRNMRNNLSPDTFVVGRYFLKDQREKLYKLRDDAPRSPERAGFDLAEFIINDDFGFAQQKGDNGCLYVNAWMTFNELLPGPASDDWQRDEARSKIIADAEAYDTFQVAFLKRLREFNLEAVAFNFAAGNWRRGEDYIKHFPKTLEHYTYLGFHEYGWPQMNPEAEGTKSGCGIYRDVMQVIRAEYGDRHKVIVTEAGLALMYKYPKHKAGDVGWRYQNNPDWQPVEEVSEADYQASLKWYNQFLNQDDYVLGACLFMGGSGDPQWDTFEHIQDEQGAPFSLVSFIQSLS